MNFKVTAGYGAAFDQYVSLSLGANCSATGTPAGCWSAGATCRAALARGDAFANDVMKLIGDYGLKGINLVRAV